MNSRADRERELWTMLRSDTGVGRIMEIYQLKVVGFGVLGQIGLLASEMIPLILNSEYSVRESLGLPRTTELSGGN